MTTDSFTYTVTEIEFSATPSRLYGYDDFSSGFEFSRLTVDGSGVTLNDSVGSLIYGYYTDIRFDAGRIYGSDGRGSIPKRESCWERFLSTTHLAALVLPNWRAAPCISSRRRPAASGRIVLRRFDPATFLQVDEDVLTGVVAPLRQSPVSSLVSFGADGLRFAPCPINWC